MNQDSAEASRANVIINSSPGVLLSIPDEGEAGKWESTELRHQHAPTLLHACVPHIGHAVLFLIITGLLLLLAQVLLLAPLMQHGASPLAVSLRHPKLLLGSEAATYLLTLTLSWFIFPLLWHHGFLAGIEWRGRTALLLALKLVSLGMFTGWTVQGISSLISMPKTVPLDDFFRSTSDVWLVTIFGTLLAPLFEEIAFRGFLLPAATIAFDWLGPALRYVFQFSRSRLRGELPPEHLVIFREADPAKPVDDPGNLAFRSLPALMLASLLTSALFGLLHAQQLGYTWAAVLLLTGVSLVLTAVRIRTRSVACSALVHGSYNLSVFIVLFIATGGYQHLDRIAH